MKKLLRFFAVCLALTLLLLIGLAYQERGKDETPYTDILTEVKEAAKQAGDSFNTFLNESGIKDGAANILEQGADMLRKDHEIEESTPPPSQDKQNEGKETSITQEWV